MHIWNDETNISNDDVRIVKFEFETDQGPGTVTTMVNKGITIPQAKEQLLQEIAAMGGRYEKIEIVGYEIIEIIDGDSDPFH